MTAPLPAQPAARPGPLLALVAIFAAFPLLPPAGVVAAGAGTILITAAVWRRRDENATSLGIFCSLCLLGVLASIPASQIWFALALGGHAIAARRISWLRGALGWLHWGSFRGEIRLLCAASAALSGTALTLWFVALRPDVSDIMRDFFPDVPLWMLLPGAVLFSMVNATVEEGAYRGVIQYALERGYGPGLFSLGAQAIAFGTLHIHGFPRGWLGVGLATVYGLMMGLIRQRAGGMLAPWAAHVATDMAIVAILLRFAAQ